ncbi:MAG TPA: type VI secretion system protein TssA [Acidiphilium sp.]|nr:type VI secretion system protein TssA [Acidiphilium sp.]
MSGTVDLDRLLAPISDEAPAGHDLREDYSPQSLYYKLRDARSDARAAERAADTDPGAASEANRHWRDVARLATEILASKAKDLEVASWMTEALVRLEGLVGLKDCATLLRGLVENYWDLLYPIPDEDGISTRVAPIAGLSGEGGDGTLIQPLRKTELFERADGSPALLFIYQQAEAVAGIGDEMRRDEMLSNGAPVLADMDNEARVAGGVHFTQLLNEARTTLTAWRALDECLTEAAGPDAPSLSRATAVLEQIISIAQRYAPTSASLSYDDDSSTRFAPDGPDDGMAGGGVHTMQGSGPAGVPRNREDALRQLNEIAEYFRRNEPQSPISMTLDEAVRRARLSWNELLMDLIPDEQSRAALLIPLGIRAD